MKKYYLHNGTQQEGPFDISELKSKNILPQTEVWFEGLEDWTEAGQIEDLKTLFSKTTPPPIRNKVTQEPIEKQKPVQVKKGNSFKTVAFIIVGAFAIIFVLSLIANSEPTGASYQEQKMTIAEMENADPIRFLSADGKYNESFWGTKLKIRGEIINQATVASYKDVTIQVTYYSKTNTVLGTNEYTLYEVFQPNTITPFKLDIDNYKDVNSIGWEVIRAFPN